MCLSFFYFVQEAKHIMENHLKPAENLGKNGWSLPLSTRYSMLWADII